VESLEMSPEFWQGKRVFLTGHTGFKGSWLALWLTQLGAKVSGYALAPPTQPSLFDLAKVASQLAQHTVADIRDLEAVKRAMASAKPDIIIHMAAQPLVREGYSDPVATYAVNVMGTVHLLEAVRGTPSARAVLIVTTDKCYENHDAVQSFRESDRLGGRDPYSNSKACAELAAAAYRQSFFAADGSARIATARAGNVIGGGDWAKDRLIPDLVQAFMQGNAPLIRSPHAVRPWQHVLEPLSGYLTLCEALWAGGADEGWNFGPNPDDAKPVSWIADRLAQLWGGKAHWTLDNNADHPHEAAYLSLDIAKAGARLNYAPRWFLDDALASIVAWYKAYAAGEDMGRVTGEQITAFHTGRKKAPHGILAGEIKGAMR
jgi:CDP-glucose 4,6-dehydratase